jgi:hypothetical protein
MPCLARAPQTVAPAGVPSTARRQYVGSSFRRIAWKNNVSPRDCVGGGRPV